MNNNEYINYLQSIHITKKQSAKRELENCEKNLHNLSVTMSLASLKRNNSKRNSDSPLYLSFMLGAFGIAVTFVNPIIGVICFGGAMASAGIGVYEKLLIKKIEKLISDSKQLEKQLCQYSKFLKSEIKLYEYLQNEAEKFRGVGNEFPKEANQSLEENARITNERFDEKEDLKEEITKTIMSVKKLAKQTELEFRIEK